MNGSVWSSTGRRKTCITYLLKIICNKINSFCVYFISFSKSTQTHVQSAHTHMHTGIISLRCGGQWDPFQLNCFMHKLDVPYYEFCLLPSDLFSFHLFLILFRVFANFFFLFFLLVRFHLMYFFFFFGICIRIRQNSRCHTMLNAILFVCLELCETPHSSQQCVGRMVSIQNRRMNFARVKSVAVFEPK